ncbi:MAG: DEAD/DEAH box helicase [Polyangiaceae bacterium]|nr:DEAD/DEAH box helicase [Polyangiaceae bacterium]
MGAFELLHPRIQQTLWDMKWTELHPVQVRAIEHLRAGGRDCVISSPTASGKTEAAFLPVLSAIADEPTGSVRAMYIGPLKALINDQFRRLEDLCERLNMPVHKWHGDVDAAARRRLTTTPSGVLLITPESLEAMFVLRATRMPSIFSRLEYVVIDELHAFLESERGAQIRSQLHRLRIRAGCNPIRIGLSATIAEPERALAWLRPDGEPATLIADSGGESALAIRVRGIWKPARAEERGEDDDDRVSDPSMVELSRGILLACHGKTNLVFANSKATIEQLADELATQGAAMHLPDEIVVHHGSLSKEQREYAEARLQDQRPCTAVCSNTLEMGINIGEVDEIVQVAAPWSVASLVQRLGRSGRHSGKRRTLRAYFMERANHENLDLWERLHLGFLQGVAIIELMLERFLEPPNTERAHLSTLIHQTISMIAETGGQAAYALYERVTAGRAFGAVERQDFAELLRELGRRKVIEQAEDGTLVLGEAGERLVEHYSFYPAFVAPSELRVISGGNLIGTIPMPPPPGEHLILAGRRWRVDQVDAARREVLVSPAKGRKPPWFLSLPGVVHGAVHEKMRELLVGSTIPAYLDATAVEMLTDARAAARQWAGFQPSVQDFLGGFRLFVWKGSRIQQTLAIALSVATLRYRDYDVGFDVFAGRSELLAALDSFARTPNEAALAAYADEQLLLRELGREKFESYIPANQWRRNFVREQLDISGAVEVATELANAGPLSI